MNILIIFMTTKKKRLTRVADGVLKIVRSVSFIKSYPIIFTSVTIFFKIYEVHTSESLKIF